MPIQRQRTYSQQSPTAPSTARKNSRGASSQRSGNPFTSNGPNVPAPPLFQTESHRDNPAMMPFFSQEAPFNTLSHPSPQLQRSMSQPQRKTILEQVLESPSPVADLDDPSKFLSQMNCMPIVSLSPSVPVSSTPITYQLSGDFNAPSTPTSDNLTSATTLTTMSRQNSIISEPLLKSMQIIKFSSSYSQTFNHDQSSCNQAYNQVPHHFTLSSHNSRRSSNEEQSQLLIGTSGASHESQFPPPFPYTSSGFSGEKTEKSQSNESTSSLSSTSSSRSK
jgi:hypothetical protein